MMYDLMIWWCIGDPFYFMQLYLYSSVSITTMEYIHRLHARYSSHIVRSQARYTHNGLYSALNRAPPSPPRIMAFMNEKKRSAYSAGGTGLILCCRKEAISTKAEDVNDEKEIRSTETQQRQKSEPKNSHLPDQLSFPSRNAQLSSSPHTASKYL